ncbi:MAG TPA: glycosyltransferase family 39 protein, partial [Pyrinomonadaceae bacterium]
MKSILAAASVALGVLVVALSPEYGVGALLLCLMLGFVVVVCISQLKIEREFLLQLFIAGLLVRIFVGTLIFYFNLQTFFGGDAFSYDFLGDVLARVWYGELPYSIFKQSLGVFLTRNWGMIYVVGAIYALLGKNMLAVQFFSAILGAATAPIIFLCAQHIYGNLRVSRFSAYFIAFYPSIVLWSSQGLKDGPLVFLLALCMYSTLKLGEHLSFKHLALLAVALFGIFTMRFYIFYMMLAAIGGSYLIGIGKMSAKSLVRNFVVLIAVGLSMMYLGVLGSAGRQFEDYANLEAIQRSRSDLAIRGESGFGKDVDVSTTGGALSAIPLGMLYLLFAPFPWQLASLRQSITFPEMVVWWVSFPVLVMGLWFTLKYRMRQALPILIFTTMLTLSYSVFQGN